MNALTRLEGRTVLLTGAAGAIGRSAAHALHSAGGRIVGVDRNKEPLVELAAAGVLDEVVVGDLAQPSFADELLDAVPDVDVLINNVGTGCSHTLADTTDDTLETMLDANLRIAFRLCRGYAPRMAKRRRGKVINVSSVLADHPVPTVAAYAASKAALIGFTRAIALEYAGRGVRCNALAPGYLAGPKNADYFASDVGKQFVDRFFPTGAIGPSDALDGPLLFLATAMSDHVNGHVLVVDGGYSVW